MLDFGLGSALVTLLPRSLAAGRWSQAQDYVTASLQGGLGLTLLLLLLGGFLTGTGLVPTPAPPFIVACIGSALNIPATH